MTAKDKILKASHQAMKTILEGHATEVEVRPHGESGQFLRFFRRGKEVQIDLVTSRTTCDIPKMLRAAASEYATQGLQAAHDIAENLGVSLDEKRKRQGKRARV